MGMKQATKAAASAKQGLFINLKDDGDETCVWFPFIGDDDNDDPFVREVVWDEKEESTVDFTAAHRAEGKEPSATFKYHVIEKTGDTYARKIYEAKIGVFQQLQEYKAKYGTYDKFYTIKRKGKAGSKKTKYVMMYDGEPNETAKKFRDEFAKHKFDLKNAGKEEDSKESKSNGSNGSSASSSNGHDAVLSEAQLAEVMPKLKEMPKDKQTDFLKKFNVTRIREIKATEFEAVKSFIAEATGKPAEGAEDAFS